MTPEKLSKRSASIRSMSLALIFMLKVRDVIRENENRASAKKTLLERKLISERNAVKVMFVKSNFCMTVQFFMAVFLQLMTSIANKNSNDKIAVDFYFISKLKFSLYA